MVEFLTADDLAAFASIDDEKAEQMIADATALAIRAAPCLGDEDTELTDNQVAAVKALLRAAILRWDTAGTGALQSETIGGFSQAFDTRQTRRGMFWPSEITDLQGICVTGDGSGAFAVDTVCVDYPTHADVCALRFGATYCSCGAFLAGFVLYEQP